MVLTLLIITLVASVALGYVYQFTKVPIELAQITKVNNAIRAVVPAFDNDPNAEVYKAVVGTDSLNVYPAKKGGVVVGLAVETFTEKGYGGRFELIVGFLPDGTINDIAVISHHETPGLGDKIDKRKSNFSLQFKGKNPKDFKMMVKKDGGDVDAITASTISSRAFCDAVTRAYEAVMKGNVK
ncbi:electron transport complex protein RnfG [Williamwhitmania taraxaci]|uniref:Ion-translocating oxidoreductase complex subunit G n=2 Tax=Williamwhitmania taraxaci TaxID=1640674 RepID=A0A1G6SMY2_9BACT|nr:electron transport complex protein RnfG [Williamwhitmania taraxaci]